MLLRSGANLLDGSLILTNAFKRLHEECYRRNPMVEDFYRFSEATSTETTDVTPMRDIMNRLLNKSGGYDQHTGVFLLTGHMRFDWDETLENL
eukprot:11330799-Prorocentrum_lima.AAC.1